MIFYLTKGDLSKYEAVRKIKIYTAYSYYYRLKTEEINKIIEETTSLREI